MHPGACLDVAVLQDEVLSINQSIIYLYQTSGPYQKNRYNNKKEEIKVIALNTA